MIHTHDILHYYMGCKFRFTYNDGQYFEAVLGVLHEGGFMCGEDLNKNWYELGDYRTDGKLELILTAPCDMSDRQRCMYRAMTKKVKTIDGDIKVFDTPKSLHYLFKNQIDAFDLIENGLAINKTIL